MLRFRNAYKLFLAALLALFVFKLLYASKALPAAAEAGFAVPVLMYHQLSEKPASWNAYVLSPAAFDEDIKLLLNDGYTPVSVNQLLAYARGEQTPPAKAVMLTFDDGDSSFYRLAWPVIQKYKIPVLVSPVASWVESASYGHSEYMTFEQVKELYDSGLVYIGNHTYDLHKNGPGRRGILKKENETAEQYRKAIAADLEKAQNLWLEHLGYVPEVFVYPYGFFASSSEQALQDMGFTVTFTCREKTNMVTNLTSLYALGRLNRPSGIGSAELVSRIDHQVARAWTGQRGE